MVGNLVGGETRRVERGLRVLEEPRLFRLRGQGQLSPAVQPVERCARLDRELVDRQVRAGVIERHGELAPPARAGLAGPGIDQIERDAVEQGAGGRDGLHRLFDSVLAAERGESLGFEGLHAERKAPDAGRAVRGEPSRLHRCRVGFEGDLDVFRRVPSTLWRFR